MDEWVWHPLAFAASVGSHWAALVSGVFGFLLSLWFAHRGKTLTFGALVAFAAFCILVSTYQAWDDEYLKNSGDVYFSFKVQSVHAIANDGISFTVNIENETKK